MVVTAAGTRPTWLLPAPTALPPFVHYQKRDERDRNVALLFGREYSSFEDTPRPRVVQIEEVDGSELSTQI